MAIVVWSAATCIYPGAGVYLGLGREFEHVAVARGLGSRHARGVAGGRARLERGRSRSIHYYAVRDPSAVRVIPIRGPRLERGFKAVELRVRIGRNGEHDSVVIWGEGSGGMGGPLEVAQAGFLLTIGLPIERESEFFERVIGRHQDQEWSELTERLFEEGCRGG